eukprot:GGOE01012918.1.p1 GENE.GGOE01012918.1~~GGOE01012918.1.p1  ORF type:complete len:935 (-),score=352.56 GGOE01012918.1:378-2891(-)
MAANVAFWKWFLNAEVVRNLTHKHSQGSMPEVVRDEVLARLVADMSCDGETVDVVEQTTGLIGQGEQPMEVLFNKFADTYSLVDTAAYVYYNSTTEAALADEADPLASYAFLVTGVPSPNTSNDFSLPFAVLGVSLISACSLILDGLTIAKILDGRITTWLDPAIVALNPGGITDTTGRNLTNRTQSIVLLRGPVGAVEMLTDVLRSYDASYTGNAIAAAPRYLSNSVLITAVVGTSYSLAVTTLAGSYSSQVRVAQFQWTDGTVVAPSWSSLLACATPNTFNAASQSFTLWKSASSACYPLCQAVYLRVRKSKCDDTTDAVRTRTVAFVEWLFSGAAVDAAMTAQGVAPLRTNTQVAAANALVLDTITCTPKSLHSDGLLVPIVIGAAAGVLTLLGVVGGWWYWRSTKQMRAMRKQFSNDNVAQECAAAIARFDLEAVAWLNTLANPNKIQSSFLKIIHLLTEVKPFIPDQLLTSLMNDGERHGGTDEDEDEDKDGVSILDKSARGRPLGSTVSSQSILLSPTRDPKRCILTPTSARSSSTCSSPRLMQKRSQGYLTRNRARGVPKSTQQWAAKRGTFLYAKFGISGQAGNLTVLDECAAALAALVSLCKKNGATIDTVAHDTVAVHWGVSSAAPMGPMHATQTALEAHSIEEAVSEHLRGDFWMRIAIGFGTCHAATLSAAGHRFFVVCGAEVSLPIEVVTTNIHARCKCSVLITPAVYQEVHFSVKCFPRVWLGGCLLWEPLQTLADTGVTDDEWMYELQKMDEKDRAMFSGQTLHRVFMMAHNGDPPVAVHLAVAELRQRYGSQLSHQDEACLEGLLASLTDPRYQSAMVADL